jgi:molecular chaperone DnaJ
MARSYFAILELTPSATPDEIRSAYRRLAKEYHPDYYDGGSGPFQEIQEAYAVLSDPILLRDYKNKTSNVQLRRAPEQYSYPEPEPLIPKSIPVNMGGISPTHSFETFSPSLAEISDWLWGNIFKRTQPKSVRIQNLTLEVTLTKDQAIRGGVARIMVPAQSTCPTCRGLGSVGFYACHRCDGQGVITGETPVTITFPPGLTKDHTVIIPLERFGIRNLHLAVVFRPRDV